MRRAFLIFAAIAALALAVHGAPRTAPPAVSEVVYPPIVRPLRFDHGKHDQVACVACHPAARTSQSALDRLLPSEAVCAACHPIDRGDATRVVAGAPAAACVACHPGYVPGAPVAHVEVPTPNLKFDHAAHASAPCARCHGDVTVPARAGRGHLPTMASCLTCHDGATAASTCGTCHPVTVDGRLQTTFPEGRLVPRATSALAAGAPHDPDFLRGHGPAARVGAQACAACHEERECVDCHTQATPTRAFHTPGYERNHGAEARRGTPDCSACHRAQTFCVGCHERVGIGTRAGSEFDSTVPGRGFHPPGWASVSASGANHHAREARRNLASCASCHREDDCLACHSAQPNAPRVSPHPPGWRGSAACEALDRRNRRTCLRCHITAEELGCDWSGLEPSLR